MCVNQQVCILHLELGTVLVIRLQVVCWERNTVQHLVVMCISNESISKWYLIDLWPCFFLHLPPPLWRCWGVWVREWERIWNISKVSWNSSAEPEWCTHSSPHALWWCSVPSVSGTAHRTQLQHSAAAQKWLYLSSLASVHVCVGWRWGIPSGIWLMDLKHCPDFLLSCLVKSSVLQRANSPLHSFPHL